MKIQWRKSANDAHFPTFCHISEYDRFGYANLHRMIAASAPLILWAPSTQLFGSSGCRVTDKEFLGFVDRGAVRIIAREWWYFDKKRRNSHSWEPAHWNWRVDRGLRSMARDDAHLEPDQRRVMLAPPHPELGDEYRDDRGQFLAEKRIDERPELVRLVNQLFESPEARATIPSGVLATALRYSDQRRGLATRVLRDAFNHSEAIGLANPIAPFYLAPREGLFLSLLSSSLQEDQLVPRATVPAGALTPEAFMDLSSQVFQLLGAFDQLEGRATLKKFMRQGNPMLAQWLGELCADLHNRQVPAREMAVLAKFRASFDDAEIQTSVQENLASKEGAFLVAGLASDAQSLAREVMTGQWSSSQLSSDPLGAVIAAAGIGASLYGALTVAGRVGGWAEAPYSGPEWPFLYAFGGGATGSRVRRMRTVLDRLS